MIIDLRYHISSLAAIFLALGIGIVIGGALLGEDGVIKEQQKIISDLEQEFEHLRTEKKHLQNMLKHQEVEAQVFRQFHQAVYPTLIKDFLKDRRIAVFRTNDSIEKRHERAVCTVLREAGAEVVSSVAFTPWVGVKLDHPKLAELFSSSRPEEAWSTHVLTSLVEGLAVGKAGRILPLLREVKILEYDTTPEKAIDSVVLVGGSNTKDACRTDLIDLPLSTAARNFGLTVIGVEPLNIQYSYIPEYSGAGLTTVDNIDTIPGRVALVYTLATRKKGCFGVKETAQALLPAVDGYSPGLRPTEMNEGE